ncbi:MULTISPECIES: hypothetical protein [Kamptonema]|uniref:hypothetical protein n=1 Tax=Kamptonema TaxID=1501433 RepID=UPI0001DAD2D0|nr:MULTISPECIES: hypothetical protein [Kamptonema]CBN54078.1 conserved hypothetical protein [Kamptonema sp. PCC 6506]
MESTQAIQDVKEKTFPATVVNVINSHRLAINRGKVHGLKEGQRLLVYCLSFHEIKDPNTGESLGYLEIVKGTGRVIHLQDKICTIESDQKRSRRMTTKRNAFYNLGEDVMETFDELIPFEDPEIGDMVKPI